MNSFTPEENPSPTEYISLDEASRRLNLTEVELATFLFHHTTAVPVFMQRNAKEAPIQAGFYGPAELLGVYRSQVRILSKDIESLHVHRLDDIEGFLKQKNTFSARAALSKEKIDATKNPVRKLLYKVLIFFGQ